MICNLGTCFDYLTTSNIIFTNYFRMDHANAMVIPPLDGSNHPVENNEDKALDSSLHSFNCPTCGNESLNQKIHQIHMEICQRVNSGQFKSPLSIQELVNLRLKIDANKMSTPIISKGNSVVSHNKKKFACFKIKCGKEFERAGDLRAHEMKHIEETESRKLKNHHLAKEVEKVEKPTPFHCPFCERKFSDATQCEKHIPIHTRTLQCTFCPKNFDSKFHLNRHLITHSKEKPFKCPQCPKGYPQLANLKLHVQSVHENYRPWKCELCGKAFTQKQALATHVRTHTGEKPYQCQYCPSKFTTKKENIVHERNHTGEKPFACKYCPMKFKEKPPLILHERIHTGEKPFQCKQCGKGFTTKRSREIHERSHTGEKPYQCEFCARRFTTNIQCKMHAESKSRCPQSTRHKD